MGAQNRQTRRALRKRAVRAMRSLYGVNRAQARQIAYKPQSTQTKALLAAITDAVNEAKRPKTEEAA